MADAFFDQFEGTSDEAAAAAPAKPSFKDAVAVLTGSANGIGEGLAKEVAARGAKGLVLADIDDRVFQVCEEIKAAGTECVAIVADVTEQEDWDKIFALTMDTFGRADFLFNDAGIEYGKPFEDTTMYDWEWYFKANVFSVVMGVNTFYPQMIKQGNGHICTTASTASLGPIVPATGIGAPYAPSKHAVLVYMEQAAMEFQLMGAPITCSAIMPCVINTDIGLRVYDEKFIPRSLKDHYDQIGGNISEEMKKTTYEGYMGLHLPKDDPNYLMLKQMMGIIEVEEGAKMVCDDIERGYFYLYTHPQMSRMVVLQEFVQRMKGYVQPISQSVASGEFSALSGHVI